MSNRSIVHATFTLERKLKSPPAKVFKAFADPRAKAMWFTGPPEWGPDQHEMDFREGGREISKGGPPGGDIHAMDGIYWEIVDNERIVMTYSMHVGDKRISVSLNTVEFFPDGSGTRLVLTEAGAYFDGADGAAMRKEGYTQLLDAMVKSVEG